MEAVNSKKRGGGGGNLFSNEQERGKTDVITSPRQL